MIGVGTRPRRAQQHQLASLIDHLVTTTRTEKPVARLVIRRRDRAKRRCYLTAWLAIYRTRRRSPRRKVQGLNKSGQVLAQVDECDDRNQTFEDHDRD